MKTMKMKQEAGKKVHYTANQWNSEIWEEVEAGGAASDYMVCGIPSEYEEYNYIMKEAKEAAKGADYVPYFVMYPDIAATWVSDKRVTVYHQGIARRQEGGEVVKEAFCPLTYFINAGGAYRIACHIVKKIAGDTKERYAGEACRQLVKYNFTEEIFQDVQIAVQEALWKGHNAGEFYFLYNMTVEGIEMKHVYGTYINKEGVKKPFYNRLYSAVEGALYQYNGRKQAKKKEEIGMIMNYDGLYYNGSYLVPTYNGEEAGEAKEAQEEALKVLAQEEAAKTGKKAAYYLELYKKAGKKQEAGSRKKASPMFFSSMQEGLQNEAFSTEVIDNVIARYDFVVLMKYIKKQASPAKFTDYCNVIHGILKGYNGEEIAAKYDLSIDVVKKARRDLKAYYKKWKEEEGKKLHIRKKASSVDYITTYSEDNTFSGKQLSEGYSKAGSRQARKKKQEGGFHMAGYPDYEAMKQEAGEAMKKYPSFSGYQSLEYEVKKQEAAELKALKAGKKASKKWQEAGRKAADAYTINEAWKAASLENIRRQEAWEDYTRYIALHPIEEAGSRAYKQEGGFLSVYEGDKLIRQYPIAK